MRSEFAVVGRVRGGAVGRGEAGVSRARGVKRTGARVDPVV